MNLRPGWSVWLLALLISIVLNALVFLELPCLSRCKVVSNIPIYRGSVYLLDYHPVHRDHVDSKTDQRVVHKHRVAIKHVYTVNNRVVFKRCTPKLSCPSFDLAPRLSMNLAVAIPRVSKTTAGSVLGIKGVKSGGIFSLGAVDEGPSVLVSINPVYPYIARIRGIQGRVVVQCVVGPKGYVRDIKILKATSQIFNQPVIDAIKKWRFRPAVYKGRHVSVRIRIPFKFRLQQDDS